MGQAQAPAAPDEPSTDKDYVQNVKGFCAASKERVGIHVFRFEKPGSSVHVITAEVSDDNNVLDVEYRLWKMQCTDDWVPVHTFGNGRVAAIAVYNLLRNEYKMV